MNRIILPLLWLSAWSLSGESHANDKSSVQNGYSISIAKWNAEPRPVQKSNIYKTEDVGDLPLNTAVLDSQTFHLFSHGRPGELLLDGQWQKATDIANFIRKQMPAMHFQYVNIYGCEFGKGEKGKAAVAYLQKHLGISVAASDDITGQEGDWELEVGRFAVVTGLNSYTGNLQCPATPSVGDPDTDGDGILDSQDLDDDNDGIPDTVEMAITCSSNTPSGTWTVSGSTATYNFGNGVIAKVTLSNPSGLTNGTFNNPATSFWNPAGVKGSTSLQADYPWGTTSTISFEDASGNPVYVNKPVLHWDRVGGVSSGTFGGTGTARAVSSRITLQNGLTWQALSTPGTQTGLGTLDFSVGATTIQDLGAGSTVNTNYLAESGDNNASSSAAGSVQLQQTVSQITMTFPSATTPPAGTFNDQIEMILSNICPVADTDGDGIPNHLDLDSDNDGISDAIEACSNLAVPTIACRVTYDAATDVDGPDAGTCKDGIPTSTCSSPVDTDNDGVPDYLDTDSDGDGCPDASEAGTKGFNVNNNAANTYTAPAATSDGLTDAGCTAPSNNHWVTAAVNFACTPPAPTDNSNSGNPIGSNVTQNILENDLLADGVTQATPSNSTVTLTTTGLPAGSALTGNVVTVPGEGTWTYDPATGNLTFDPQDGFITDPTPLTYTLTETSTGLSDTATVTVGYNPMPVTLIGFRVAESPEGARLTWTTSFESNFDRFEIEKAVGNIKAFTLIGTVRGGQTPYQFTDMSKVSGTAYYRLKMIDLDGTYEYSRIVALQRALTGTVYPNPSADRTVRIDAEQIDSFRVLDASGREVKAEMTKQGNAYQFRINGQAQPGIYILEYSSGNLKSQAKFLLTH